MICSLTIVRYPRYSGFFGMLSMALFRLPLSLNKNISFYKLLGCGKNGTFDIKPDWRQWGVLTVNNNQSVTNYSLPIKGFLQLWWEFFHCEVWTLLLEPIEGHGTWDGKHCFGELPKQTDYEGLTGVLTRASIRYTKLKRFWQQVDAVTQQMASSPGFIFSAGISELPWIKGATFSLWDSKASMKQFAYKMKGHADVVVKTKKENWYKEDMFVRFKPIASTGTLHGIDPLKGKL